MNLSFRTRMALLFSALFLAVEAVTFTAIYWFSRDIVIRQLGQNLAYAEQVFKQLLMERGERIASETRVLVADFGFRSTVSLADSETVASALENLTYRIRGQRGFYVELGGKVVADTAGHWQGQPFVFRQALNQAEDQGKAVAFGLLDGRLHELSIVPVLAPIPIGWVGIATAVDSGLTHHFKRLAPANMEISLTEIAGSGSRLLASSLRAEFWPKMAHWVRNQKLGPGIAPQLVRLGNESFITVLRALPAARDDQMIGVVLQIDLAAALAPYRTLMYAAFGLTVMGAGAALLGSIAVADRLARPVRALADATDMLLEGRFEQPLPIGSRDELGKLAETFTRASRIAAEMSELQRQDRRRRELVADVSHDLRTPISALHGYLETLKLKADSLPPEESRRFLDVAVRQSEKLGRLARELFELARLECEETLPLREDFCIADLVQDVIQKFQLQADNRGVALRANCTPKLPMANADLGMTERVLTNLIDNALRHTGTGGAVEISLSLAGDRLLVAVADTGCGIAAHDLPKLFDRDSPLSRRGDGPGGLGLVLVAKMLGLHGCSIEADSVPGQGSVFRFGLPLAQKSCSRQGG